MCKFFWNGSQDKDKIPCMGQNMQTQVPEGSQPLKLEDYEWSNGHKDNLEYKQKPQIETDQNY